jgi:7-cyano-7-deazaguanine synthase
MRKRRRTRGRKRYINYERVYMKGLVLHSGGLDSSTLLALAVEECDEVVGLSIAYGQKHQDREIRAAREVCKHYVVEHMEIELPDIFKGFGSTLMDSDKDNPHLSYEEIKNSEGPSPTYVPFRNANLLSIATAIAQIQKCDIVYFGAHADDAHNYAYPDCTPEFIGAMANAINVGTYYTVRLKTPIMWMTKGEVVSLGSRYSIPFELTYSCYEGTEIHCGECSTCISRQVAFEEARVDDPTEYTVQSLREKTFHG